MKKKKIKAGFLAGVEFGCHRPVKISLLSLLRRADLSKSLLSITFSFPSGGWKGQKPRYQFSSVTLDLGLSRVEIKGGYFLKAHTAQTRKGETEVL